MPWAAQKKSHWKCEDVKKLEVQENFGAEMSFVLDPQGCGALQLI